MKNNNEIRKLLKDAIDYKGDYAYSYIIKKCKEALILLNKPELENSQCIY